jgi:putative ABC transport system permease protein
MSNPNHTHFYCIATVKSPTDLEAAVDAVENQGFETRSAIGILQRADEELWKARLIVAALALVIMLIASVGIMNTMIIAVMERTPEFGIMKAVGANDSDIRRLMLLEAALTGVLGVAISLILVRIVDGLASGFARQYIESRLKEDFEFSVFVYSLSDTLIVVAIAIAVCTLASLIPSNRAAKLDPVVAMRSR